MFCKSIEFLDFKQIDNIDNNIDIADIGKMILNLICSD